MRALRELAAIIGEQAVAIDLGRRLLQEAVDGRQVAEARADKAEAELAEVHRNSDIRYKEWRDLRAFAQVVRVALQEQCWQATREQIETAVADLDKLNAARK
jgi:uncharacterized protein YpuA (DUF1002 family)